MVTAMPFGYVISEREWGRSLPIVSSSFLTSAKKSHSKKRERMNNSRKSYLKFVLKPALLSKIPYWCF